MWEIKARLLFLLCLLLVFAGLGWVAGCWGEDTSAQAGNSSLPTPAPVSPPNSSTPTEAWQNFDEAWQSLKLEFSQSEQDSQAQLLLLMQVQKEVKELQSSLTQSTAQSDSLKLSYSLEREQRSQQLAAEKAARAATEKLLLGWKIVGVGAIIIAVISTAAHFAR